MNIKEPKMGEDISNTPEKEKEKEIERQMHLFKESLKAKSLEELSRELKLLKEQFWAIPEEKRTLGGLAIYTYEAADLKRKTWAIEDEIEIRK